MSEFYDEKPKKHKNEDEGGLPTIVKVVLIIIAAIIVMAFACVVVLAMLGPSIGNIFSNVIDGLSTPAP